jgi:hypothetical protein
MLFKQEAHWVFDKSPHTGKPKTQICLPVKQDDLMLCKPTGEIIEVRCPRRVLKVGGYYHVEVQRGQPSLGRIVVKRIALTDVRAVPIYWKEAGYASAIDLASVWAHRYDTEFYDEHILGKVPDPPAFWARLLDRPAHLYECWRITFEPVIE